MGDPVVSWRFWRPCSITVPSSKTLVLMTVDGGCWIAIGYPQVGLPC